jgi:hypothetical protein
MINLHQTHIDIIIKIRFKWIRARLNDIHLYGELSYCYYAVQ